MAPVSKRRLPKKSNTNVKVTSTLSKIIMQGTEQLLDSGNNTNIHVIEKPRMVRYSNSSLYSALAEGHSTPEINIVASNSNAHGKVELNSEISDMSIASVSVRNKPFVNFLQDFSIAHGSVPRESIQQAIVEWDKLTAEQKQEYTPENYVLKLCDQVHNRDEILNAATLHPVYPITTKIQNAFNEASTSMKSEKYAKKISSPKIRKTIKRLKAKPRVLVTPRKSAKNAGKKNIIYSGSAYKNFLRKTGQANPGLMIVEKASLWRKMTPAERDLYRNVSRPRRQNTKVSRVDAPKREKKRKTSQFTQISESDFSETNFNIQRDGQLEVWNGSTNSLEEANGSWFKFGYIAKALGTVKSIFK